MWRVVLAALCLAASGCGGETGECDMADGVVLNDVFYLGTEIDPPRPRPGRSIDGGSRPDCHGGGIEVDLRAVEGLPPEVAVYRDAIIPDLYVNPRYFLWVGDSDAPPPRARGARCALVGTVVKSSPLRMRTSRRTWRVRVPDGTRFARFDRSSIPYLGTGDRVRVRGHGCRGESMVARRIELLP